jgi:Mce-associated membrane protein
MVDDQESAVANSDADKDDNSRARPTDARDPLTSNVRLALAAGSSVLVILCGFAGAFAYRGHQSHLLELERQLFLNTGRQAALDLTTISHTEVDADVHRILDSSTGAYHDEFQLRAQPFIDIVKRDQSVSTGTIIEAGLESIVGDTGVVSVAVSVKTTTPAIPEPRVNSFRMRIEVKRVAHGTKVSNVDFVS